VCWWAVRIGVPRIVAGCHGRCRIELSSNLGRDTYALGVLAEHLDGAQLSDALDAARQISDEPARAQALGVLAEHLDGAQLSDALDAARQISDEDARADALGVLAEHLDGDVRRDALSDALDVARQISDEPARAQALRVLAEHLDGDVRCAQWGVRRQSPPVPIGCKPCRGGGHNR
jgi:hypothetical protein